MDATQLVFGTVAASAQTSRAHVARVYPDGTVGVTRFGEAGELACDVLLQGDGALALAEGDVVLVWHAGSHQDRGVVLGRIGSGRTRAEGPPDVPDSLVIEAKQDLTFKCGEGSITLRADGKVLIKGKDLVSHAQRMNRIKGGAVAIN